MARAVISPRAWAQTITTTKHGSIVSIEVETTVDVPSKDPDAPPRYDDHKSERSPQPTLSFLPSDPKPEKKWEFWRWKF